MIVPGGTIDDSYELGLVVPSIENGTLNKIAAMLLQAGFGSRLEAIRAIQSTGGTFSNSLEFKVWLSSDAIKSYVEELHLNNETNAKLWEIFLREYKPKPDTAWKGVPTELPVIWEPEVSVEIGQLVKLYNAAEDRTMVLGSDGDIIGKLQKRYALLKNGVYRSQVQEINILQITYWGAGGSPFETDEF